MLEYNRSIAVILPAYNEELTIAGTLRAFHAVMPDAFFYVVDNNSTDATAHIAEETLANLGAQGGLLHEARQGKGNAVRRAFFEIDADVYVLVDADMTYPAEALPQLVAPILAGEADMVYGDRLSEGDYARQNRRTFHGFWQQSCTGACQCRIRNAFYRYYDGIPCSQPGFCQKLPRVGGRFSAGNGYQSVCSTGPVTCAWHSHSVCGQAGRQLFEIEYL